MRTRRFTGAVTPGSRASTSSPRVTPRGRGGHVQERGTVHEDGAALQKPYMMIYCQHDHPRGQSRVLLLLLPQTHFFHHLCAYYNLFPFAPSRVMTRYPQTWLESCSETRSSSSRDDRLRTRASGPLVPTSSPNTDLG